MSKPMHERLPHEVTNIELIDTIREHYQNDKIALMAAYRLETAERKNRGYVYQLTTYQKINIEHKQRIKELEKAERLLKEIIPLIPNFDSSKERNEPITKYQYLKYVQHWKNDE